MGRQRELLATVLLVLFAVLIPLPLFARSLGCESREEVCSELWVAAQEAEDPTSAFEMNTLPKNALDIKIGDSLVTSKELEVRSGPASLDGRLFILGKGATVLVRDLKSLSVSGGPSQIWVQITTPDPGAPVPSASLATQLAASLPLPAVDVLALLEGREIYYDDSGLIVHKGSDGKFDGGDTSQREGWYWLGVWIRQNTPGLEPWKPTRRLNFDQVLRLLEPNSDGIFYRHPTQPPFNNPFDKKWGTSRDQLVPLVAAMGMWGKIDEIRRLWNALPEDFLGKHAFNGNWRNFLGQAGPNCSEINKRDCTPTADCSLKQDTRDCSLRMDTRDCSLKADTRSCALSVDTRSCPSHVDTRSCGHDVHTPFGNVHINDPACETAKASQNGIYAAAKASCESAKAAQNIAYASTKAACEAAKASQNSAYAAQKTECESEKATQNGIYAADKVSCESQKTSQNAAYAAAKATCETAKTAGKVGCETDKAASYQLCRLTDVYSGDIIGPSTINLFRRAIGKNPLIPNASDLEQTILHGGLEGDSELLVDSHIRVGQTQHDRDDVGDDLNHIVMLLMARLRFPNFLTDEATRVYAEERQPSYGSYLAAYYTHYGDDPTDIEKRIDQGIADGWTPDVSAPYGAVRWYHRADTGANPQLATLYSVIIGKFIH